MEVISHLSICVEQRKKPPKTNKAWYAVQPQAVECPLPMGLKSLILVPNFALL